MDVTIFFSIAILIMSVVIHEVAHGYAALWLGDVTAKYAGRLTLNPIKHLDLFGSIILPGLLILLKSGFIIGWAKPVPYNPYNLKNQRWGELIVAIAGPISNIIIALFFGLIIRFANLLSLSESFVIISGIVVFINLLLAIFNLMPIPPLDGSKILFALLPPEKSQSFRIFMEKYSLFFLIIFIFFFFPVVLNLINFFAFLIIGINFF